MIKMRKCKYCNITLEVEGKSFANHVRWCDKNPKVENYKTNLSTIRTELTNKKFGQYKTFTVKCEVCLNDFAVKEREQLFPCKEKYFCSRECANSIGGMARSKKYYDDDNATFRTVAWRHHKRKCVVCNETNIVAVHHMNENHDDNDPKNLVPLCPTHHQYMHTRHKEKIIDVVNNYIKQRWNGL